MYGALDTSLTDAFDSFITDVTGFFTGTYVPAALGLLVLGVGSRVVFKLLRRSAKAL